MHRATQALVALLSAAAASGCARLVEVHQHGGSEGAGGDASVSTDLALAHVRVSNSGLHGCAVSSSSGVVCWGSNMQGALGSATGGSKAKPTEVVGLPNDVVGVAAGELSSCAWTADGAVWCWGGNHFGQLGDGTTTDRPVAVRALVPPVVYVGSQGEHACALTASRDVYCWGRNDVGQLGDGTETDNPTPARVASLPDGVSSLSVGYLHTCVRVATVTSESAEDGMGRALCWGDGTMGRLGNGVMENQPMPVPALGGASDVTAVTAGYDATCAVRAGGTVQCWGDPDVMPSAAPSDAAEVVVAATHACARTTQGAVRCWGKNKWGQLGDGSTEDSAVPVDVVGLGAGVVGVTSAGAATCAELASGAIQCWGYNAAGQLGDGTHEDRPLPVVVAVP